MFSTVSSDFRRSGEGGISTIGTPGTGFVDSKQCGKLGKLKIISLFYEFVTEGIDFMPN